MVVLKKIRSATLIEALAAVLIIVSLFMIASTSLNNVFSTHIKNNDHELKNRTKELIYLASYDRLALPFEEDSKEWEIYILKTEEGLQIEITNKKSKREETLFISP